MYEFCYLENRPVATANKDEEKAFDSPGQPTFELSHMRLAIPDRFVLLDTKINRNSTTRVRHKGDEGETAFSQGFKRGMKLNSDTGQHEGTGQACVQGSTEGASLKYVAMGDVCNSYWEANPNFGVQVATSAFQSATLKTGEFADYLSGCY
jgi:hypothetical protein